MKKLLGLLILPFICTAVGAEVYLSVCANHILVPTEEEALNLKSKIKTYSDFQNYAREYSKCPSGREGGSLGCFYKGQMVKPFEKAAFDGKVGEVTGPVQTQFGYHLIWVTKKY